MGNSASVPSPAVAPPMDAPMGAAAPAFALTERAASSVSAAEWERMKAVYTDSVLSAPQSGAGRAPAKQHYALRQRLAMAYSRHWNEWRDGAWRPGGQRSVDGSGDRVRDDAHVVLASAIASAAVTDIASANAAGSSASAAIADARLLGFGSFNGAACQVSAVHVHSDAQNRGVGGAVLHALLRHAQARTTCERVHVLASLNAAAFYRRHGFAANPQPPAGAEHNTLLSVEVKAAAATTADSRFASPAAPEWAYVPVVLMDQSVARAPK